MNKLIAALILTCISSASSAATVGFRIVVSGGNFDAPSIRVTNISDSAQLTNFTLTIGDRAFNFDRAWIAANSQVTTATLTRGDSVNGAARVNRVDYSFTNFNPGDFFRFRAEIDPDNSNATVDYRSIFFNNSTANSRATATFDTPNGPPGVSRVLNDRPATNTRFGYSRTVQVTVVPLPAGGGLLLAGLAGLALMRRKGS